MKRLILIGLAVFGISNYSDAHHISGKHARYASSDHGEFFEGGIYATFHSSLSGYGEWIDCNYGYAWRPFGVGSRWRPYYHGRWAWTDYGWYWVSYEPYGWAVYHYGRWHYDDYYGWIWIPDQVWGPAWVEWRYSDDYIGWAPLTPYATFSIDFGVTLTHGWVAPVFYWNFVTCHDFTAARVGNYVQPVEQTRRLFGNTRNVPNIRSEGGRVVNRGVETKFVERKAGVKVRHVEIVENRENTGERIVRNENRERLEIYRPDVRQAGSTRETAPNELRREPDPRKRNIIREWKEQQRENSRPGREENRSTAPTVRQFRESEQRFEIPRTMEINKEKLRESFERKQRGTDARNDNIRQDQRTTGTPSATQRGTQPARREQGNQSQRPSQTPSRGGGRRP